MDLLTDIYHLARHLKFDPDAGTPSGRPASGFNRPPKGRDGTDKDGKGFYNRLKKRRKKKGYAINRRKKP